MFESDKKAESYVLNLFMAHMIPIVMLLVFVFMMPFGLIVEYLKGVTGEWRMSFFAIFCLMKPLG